MHTRSTPATKQSSHNGTHGNGTTAHFENSRPETSHEDLENGEAPQESFVASEVSTRFFGGEFRWLWAIPLTAMVILLARDWRGALGGPARTSRAILRALPSIQPSSILIGTSSSASALQSGTIPLTANATEAAKKPTYQESRSPIKKPSLNATQTAARLLDAELQLSVGYRSKLDDKSLSAADGGDSNSSSTPAVVRRLKARIVVVPSRFCQEVYKEREEQCFASGANSTDCLGMFRGGNYMHSYTAPFVRIAGEMQALGFNYSVTEVGPTNLNQPMDGKTWDLSLQAADILIVEEHSLQWLQPIYHDKLYVALQGNAAAALLTCIKAKLCAHDHLQRKEVVRYLQHTVLSPLTINNADRLKHLPHYSLMNRVHVLGQAAADLTWRAAGRTPMFTREMLLKVRLLIPMFWRWRYPMTCRGQLGYVTHMVPSLAAPLGKPPSFLPDIKDRPIDIAFSGSTSAPYWRNSKKERKQNELYALHRGRMVEELDRIRKANPQLRIETAAHVSYPEFVELLRNCKIFISPLGHGEYSGKDYEATISRAVMVKPLARHLESYPDIYEVNVTCAETRMDFSDLEPVVKGLLADPNRMQAIADEAYNRMVKYSNPKILADDVAAMLHELAAEKGLEYED